MGNLFGWCAEIDDAELVHKAGFDFMECSLLALKLETPFEANEMMARFINSPTPVKAFNRFFSGNMKVTGPEVDRDRVKRYIASAAEALHKIGSKIAVMGSGGARSVPDGWDINQAREQLLELFSWISDAFNGSGVTLAIEPVNRKESNIILSVSEAVWYAKQINRETVRVLADFYHMDEENELLDTLTENMDWLVHIHVADTGRLSPGTGQYPYPEFFSKLQSSGYGGMISAECKTNNFEKDIQESLSFLRGSWQNGRL